MPIQKAPVWLVTSYFVADQRFQWPFNTWLLLSPISGLLFFLSSQISNQWKNFLKTPELSLPWHAAGRRQGPCVTFERDIFRILSVLSWFKKSFLSIKITLACFKHIEKPGKSEYFCSCAWVWSWISSFAGEKDSLLLFSLLCIFLCSLTPSFVCQQPSKLKANCSLFNHCLEKTVSWSLYKWAGTRICFNSFQSLW